MSESGLVTRPSAHGFDDTLGRLTAALEARGITVFARIDHALGAASVGMPLRPTTLVIFGNPAAGTPVMQAEQTAGIDLPLKILVFEDEQGAVQLSTNDPAWIAARHGTGAEVQPVVAKLAAVLEVLAREAAGA